jgi:DNA-binding LacI/PurR family transcriptional regulator
MKSFPFTIVCCLGAVKKTGSDPYPSSIKARLKARKKCGNVIMTGKAMRRSALPNVRENAGDREATILDVARTAGVSKSTVSRVLNGSVRISPRTRARVLEAIDRLDYRINVAARTLRTTKSSLVALLVPAIGNDVFGRIAEVLEEDLRQDGTGLVIMSSGWAAQGELLAFESLRSRQVDAVVASVVDDRAPQMADTLRALRRPLILLDREVRGIGADVVLTDQRSGIHAALEHLASIGHRSIGLASISPTVRPGREAMAAYKESIHSLSLTSVGEMVIAYERVTAASGAEVAAHMIQRGATAIVCCVPNLVTAGVLEAVHNHGLSIPDDISIIAFDDSELASIKPPRLTVITRPLDEVAHHASRMVITRLANPELPPRAAVVHMTLTLRESTAAPSPARARL